jgi:excisionase family DNA binding protein
MAGMLRRAAQRVNGGVNCAGPPAPAPPAEPALGMGLACNETVRQETPWALRSDLGRRSSGETSKPTTVEVSERVGRAGTNVVVTMAEAAQRLGIHVRTVQAMIRRGAIPVVRFGRSVRVYAPALATVAPRHRKRRSA